MPSYFDGDTSMLQLLSLFIHAVQPFLVPICFAFAWLFVILTVWSLFSTVSESLGRARQMHQVPCANCQYFTGDYGLKCTVHPSIALSEEAIHCPDYDPIPNLY